MLAGKPNCFCAGLDVKLLATSDHAGLREFFGAYLSALQTPWCASISRWSLP